MNLMPVINRLAGAGLGTPGETLFLDMFPAQCQHGILVRSRIVGEEIDYDLPGYLKFQFQLMARSLSRVGAEDLSNRSTKALYSGGCIMDDWTVNYIRPMHIPASYPTSIGEVTEFNVDFAACIVSEQWALR